MEKLNSNKDIVASSPWDDVTDILDYTSSDYMYYQGGDRSQVGVRVKDYFIERAGYWQGSGYALREKYDGKKIGDKYFSPDDIAAKKIDALQNSRDFHMFKVENIRDEMEQTRAKYAKIGHKIVNLFTKKGDREMRDIDFRLKSSDMEVGRIDARIRELEDFISDHGIVSGDRFVAEKHKMNRVIAKNIYRRRYDKFETYSYNDEKLSLSGIHGFDEMIQGGVPGVEKRAYSHLGNNIDVYDLNGAPFKFLISVLGASITGNTRLPTDSVEGILEYFNKTRIELEREGYHTNEYISTSLISDRLIYDNLSSQPEYANNLFFGYSEVSRDEVIGASKKNDYGDAYVVNNSRTKSYDHRGEGVDVDIDVDEMEARRLEVVADERYESNGIMVNEIAIDRYSDRGSGFNFYDKSRKPDFMVSIDNNITEDALRIASSLNISIVNINKDMYVRPKRKPRIKIRTKI